MRHSRVEPSMHTSILTRPTDRPPRQEAWGTGTAMSAVAHALLIAGLVWGVHWRSTAEPEGVAAELWSAVPQISAPPPPTEVEPPPPPPKPAPEPAPPQVQQKAPDIVLEQEKKRKEKEQQEREEQAKKEAAQKAAEEKAAQDKAKAEAEKQKQLQAKLRQEQLNRVMGQLGAPANSTGTAAQTSGPSASYAGRIKARVRPNIVFSDSLPDNPAAEVLVTLAPDGTVIGRRITKSSGVQAWDDAVVRAIDRTAVLPTDNGKVYPMTLVFRPND